MTLELQNPLDLECNGGAGGTSVSSTPSAKVVSGEGTEGDSDDDVMFGCQRLRKQSLNVHVHVYTYAYVLRHAHLVFVF